MILRFSSRELTWRGNYGIKPSSMALIEGKKLQQAVAVAGPIGIRLEARRRIVYVPGEVLNTVSMVLSGEGVSVDVKADDSGGVTVEEDIQLSKRKTPVGGLRLPVGKKYPRIEYRKLPADWLAG